MSKIVVLFAMFLGIQAQAQSSVSVIIDGKAYSCTQGGIPANTCGDRADAMKVKFNACKNIYSTSDCFNTIYKPAMDKSCANMVEDCNNVCKNIYSSSDCYRMCF